MVTVLLLYRECRILLDSEVDCYKLDLSMGADIPKGPVNRYPIRQWHIRHAQQVHVHDINGSY